MKLVLEDEYEDLLKDIRHIRILYVGFFLSLVLELFPNPTVSMIAASSFLLCWLWARRLKRKQGEETLLGNHAIYILLSIRVFFYVLIAGIILAHGIINRAATQEQMEVFSRMLLSALIGGDTLPQAFQYFYTTHPTALILASFVGVILPFAYIFYRFVRGGMTGHRGDKIARPHHILL